MTVYGATSTGYRRKPFAEILSSVKARARALVGAQLELDDKDPFGAIVHAACEQIDEVWQAEEAAYYGYDPDNAEDFLMFALCGLTGISQLPPTKGVCTSCTLGLEANKSFAAGQLVASVTDSPANRWVNRDAITSTTAGVYTGVVFISEGTGSLFAAPAGSLAVIAQRVSGWLSITNASDAVAGNDAESVDDCRVRRNESLAIQGSASVTGIQSDVAAVPGVIQVKVYENATEHATTTLPAHSCRVIVWDGVVPQANGNAIAQAIQDSKSAGISSIGILSGVAIDGSGVTSVVAFDRSAIVQLYCEVTVQAPIGVSVSAVKAAIQAKVPGKIGELLILLSARASALAVDGVIDVPVFTLDTVYPPLNSLVNIQAGAEQILYLDSANITVTVL